MVWFCLTVIDFVCGLMFCCLCLIVGFGCGWFDFWLLWVFALLVFGTCYFVAWVGCVGFMLVGVCGVVGGLVVGYGWALLCLFRGWLLWVCVFLVGGLCVYWFCWLFVG